MVLGCDFYFAGLIIKDRLVSSTVPKLELEGLSATGQRKQLVSRQIPKNRSLAD